MHEFGIAWEIWQSVRKAAAAQGGGHVRRITVEIGELNLIEDEQLRFWLTALAERDGSPEVELRIAHVPATVKCRACGDTRTGDPSSSPASGELVGEQAKLEARFLPRWHSRPGPCQRCGSSEVEAVGGREIRVVSAQIVAEEQG